MRENVFAAEIRRFREFLESQAFFDEEYWIGVAQTWPTICTAEYALNSLDSARIIACHNGFGVIANWLDAALLLVRQSASKRPVTRAA